ncbi:MAG: precorrin-8X methylmutase [Actinomycetia bacterium]|nr:precorrin-8X methylmutase [Actinomycetes bacterium]
MHDGDPEAIYRASFRAVRARLGRTAAGPGERAVVERVVHATADVALGESLRFRPGVVDQAVAALRAGAPIVVDSRMVAAGLLRHRLGSVPVKLWLDASGVEQEARARGVTRSRVAMERAVRHEPDGAVYVVGNAPTALDALVDALEAGLVRPAAVVGLPVGFVGAREAKARLWALADAPAITNVGPRGGSAAAAAATNALLLLAAGAPVTGR